MAITKHVYQIFIKATPEQVWDAIVEPAWTRRYFHGTAFDSPPVGRAYRTSLGDGRPAVDGVIEELDPPNRLVMTWHVLYDPALSEEPPSRVEWTLSQATTARQIDLVHGDLALSPLTSAVAPAGCGSSTSEVVARDGRGLPPVADDAPAPWPTCRPTVLATSTGGQGIEANNGIWDLVGEPASAERDEELLRRAYASAYHWQRASRRRSRQRCPVPSWLISRAHAVLGHGELGLAPRRPGRWPSPPRQGSPTSTSPTPMRRGPGRWPASATSTRPPPSSPSCCAGQRPPTTTTVPLSNETSPKARGTAWMIRVFRRIRVFRPGEIHDVALG